MKPDAPGSGRPPFVAGYLLYLLAAASAAASGSFHARVRRGGLKPIEWRVLACLHDNDGQMVTTLARTTLLEQSRLTRILDQMAAAGLVVRSGDAADRRRVRIAITEAGRDRAAPLVAEARAHEAALLAAVAPCDAMALKALLARIAEAAETLEETSP